MGDSTVTPTATIPTAALSSLIAAALRLINSSVVSLPVQDLVTVLPMLQHTNAVTSHTIRRLVFINPTAPGIAETLSAGQQVDRDVEDIADLSAYFEAMSTDGVPSLLISFQIETDVLSQSLNGL